ncbi:MAG: winged helix DNA-binding domain-containing protein [Anaerolineaceae bacterium]|nr:MAG: winged helix DNA-binding domain-containing protein [Anaerolineaceae bacterium]
MVDLDTDILHCYRAQTYRLLPGAALSNKEDAIAYVEERGFMFFWPIRGVDMPSLWTATAGDRPVAAEHDDPGHVTWGWKDDLLDKRCWYYGKLLRGKATLVSLATLPYFYALSPRLAELDDYRMAYEEGKLTREARVLADVLLKHGAQHTIELRRLAYMSSTTSKARFLRALTELQRGLWVLPIGIARAGSWRYAFTYELFDRWFPETYQRARGIRTHAARSQLLRLQIDSVGTLMVKDVRKLFGWREEEIKETLSQLEDSKDILQLEDGRWATAKLFQKNG